MTAQDFRNPAPAGILIDRNRPVSFTFEERKYTGFSGDTIASALAANGVRVLSRSFKYHRPRGLLTAAGQDANTLVQLPDEPNVAADRYPISEGLEVRGQNYHGSLERDRDAILGWFGRFMPPGFYYRAFFRPLGAWQKYWEPVFRRHAGLGRVSLETRSDAHDKMHLFCDVAIVGAGPAGLKAAFTAAASGAEVLLIDENPWLGGALAYARFGSDGFEAKELRARLIHEVQASSRIRIMMEAQCTGWFADNWLAVCTRTRLHKVRAKQIIFATGAIEQPIVFRNNDLPGILLGSAAQRLLRLYGVRPGRRAVILTGNDDGYGVALDLAEAGIEIAAIAELRPGAARGPMADEARRRGLPLRQSKHVDAAEFDSGRQRVRACRIDGVRFDCDLICMSPGWVPAYQLPAQAGATVAHSAKLASFVVGSGASGTILCGSVNGSWDLEAVIADGRHAGWAASTTIGFAAGPEPPIQNGASGYDQFNLARPIYPHPKGKEFIDFDEDIEIRDLVHTVREGYDQMELVKRFSTVGMGPSQGRQSALNAARIVATELGRPLEEFGITTARPPAFAERLALLAGRNFQPQRLTPMHWRHLELGAPMIAVGAWLRPTFYGPSERREENLETEVAAVHTNVGMIDVSTLGKIELRGPDAAEFLERFYTFSHAKQPVGRVRYLLMTNEGGTVSDDGVSARLSHDHFFLTATTSGVDAVFRQMLWWKAQWQLQVDISNVTAGYAAVNLAGPRSRDVLSKAGIDTDISREGFPYLNVREALIGAIPARLLRIGFVGELGYEIHVPTQMGEELWDRLSEAGREYGLRPVGIEAQRVLRLEKGHIIVGQDTDGLSTPAQIGMEWAVSMKKPFFVGQRSLALRNRGAAKRRLVGFSLPLDSPVPEESCLAVDAGQMVGVVTSAARSRACGRVIGLAYIRPELAAIGSPITIRLADGRDVGATVAATPFYDAGNLRQDL